MAETPTIPDEKRFDHIGLPVDHPASRVLAQVKVEGYEHIDPLTYDFEGCWTRTRHDQPYLKDDVVAAIIASGSDWSGMSLLLGRNRQRIKDYVVQHLDLYEIFLGVEQTFLDLIEKMGKVQAAMGDGAQIRFFLTTLGKDRGYTTRSELGAPGGGPLMGPDLSDYTVEELEQLAEVHRAAQARKSGIGSN